ncbi:DUF3237 domain-containing protein [Rhizobium alvei]|uniref:UPF0311 protein Q4481_22295 n=1 Tax=Rhizobium alvei TaxID=1132659 RepID=A0ABT8YTH8_9HYPH|nr:DUF3237 domain-containing protein [Rhizobium alvei]MDO6966692.1 DUF3237 domain-containing protein [Rhizobium alvei]
MTKPVVPTAPGLDFAFLIRAEIGKALSGGLSPKGERLHIPILGGTVEGPLLAGKVLPGGSDWPLVRSDGTSEISARYTIEADDGALIEVRNEGLRVSSPEVLARLRAGERVDPSEFYFRSAPVLLAPSGRHGWMNDTLFLASLCRDGDCILVAVHRVT